MKHPLRIVVLEGGISSEREVSFMSGGAIAEALRSLGHQVDSVDVSDRALTSMNGHDPDVVFIALHGLFGEDGGVQAQLEHRGIPYTGSGVDASKLAMNKLATKELFIEHKIPTPDYCAVTKAIDEAERRRLVEALGLPVVVKPVAEGSSVGVSIVRDMAELDGAFELGFQHGEHLIAESFVEGREFTVGVLGSDALPVIELVPKREFYNYEAKYVDDDTEYLLTPEISDECYRRVQETSLRVHEVLGCIGFSRVDLMLDADEKEYVLEVNTIPGFTTHSLLPKAAAHVGIQMPELCQRIVKLALNGKAE